MMNTQEFLKDQLAGPAKVLIVSVNVRMMVQALRMICSKEREGEYAILVHSFQL